MLGWSVPRGWRRDNPCDHVNKLKARNARLEWRELSGLTHYEVSAYTSALNDASRWLQQVWN